MAAAAEEGAGAGACDKEEKHHAPHDLSGDLGSICLLLLLYTLQGIPMGLSASIPLVLQDRVRSHG